MEATKVEIGNKISELVYFHLYGNSRLTSIRINGLLLSDVRASMRKLYSWSYTSELRNETYFDARKSLFVLIKQN